MKPIIGIVVRPSITESGRESTIIYNSVRDAVVQKGGIPLGIIMPHLKELTEEEKEDLNRIVYLCDGIIEQGGDDFYSYDLSLLKTAYDKDIPTLGICLGMQAMGVLLGGNMEDIADGVNHNQKDTDYVHSIQIVKDSKLHQILETDTILVNSRHKSYLTNTELLVSARSTDNIIEAVEASDKKFFIGLQWHPEDMLTYDSVESKLFDFFINICKR